MAERDESPEQQTATAQQPPADPPQVSEQEASQAMAEGAGEAVSDEQASESMAELPPTRVETPAGGDSPTVDDAPPSAWSAVEPERDTFGRHPEYFAGGAFVGGLVLAQILKRFGHE